MILAVDYGQKKLGLAVSDETHLVASALPTKRARDNISAITKILESITEFSISELVVGVPSGWQNVDSPQTTIVRDFITLLKKSINIPIHEWDETYSTKIAEKNITHKQKKNSDSYAAALILQEYLDYQRYEKNH